MRSINEIQEEIINDLTEIGDTFDQYSYLTELAGILEGLTNEEKTDDILVKGCQSRVWLLLSANEGKFYMRSDSDTLIIKGILALLEEIFNGQPLCGVANAEITFLKQSSLMETFEESRQKGIGYILRQSRDFARMEASKNGGDMNI